MVCCQSVCLPVCPFMFICLIVLTTACTFDMLVICPLICIVPAVSYFCLLFSHCSVFYLSVPRRVPIWPRSSVGRTTLICSGGRGFESHQGQIFFPFSLSAHFLFNSRAAAQKLLFGISILQFSIPNLTTEFVCQSIGLS